MLFPIINMCNSKNPLYQTAGAFAKNNHADGKQNGINQTGHNNPFPKLMLSDKAMRFDVRLKCNDDFLEQAV